MKQINRLGPLPIIVKAEHRKARSLYKWLSRVTGLETVWIENVDETASPVWGFVKRVAKNAFAVRSQRFITVSFLSTVLFVVQPSKAKAQTTDLLDISVLDGKRLGFKLNVDLSIARVSDINGDGFDDVLVSERNYLYSGSFVGKLSVFFGSENRSQSNLEASDLDGSNGFIIRGTNNTDSRITGVSRERGDLNGDGFDDVVITENSGGDAFIVFGKSGGFSSVMTKNDLDGSNGFLIDNENSFPEAAFGDINGDGIDDLLITGARLDPNGLNDAGQVSVLFGQTGAFSSSFNISEINGSNGFIVTGEKANDRFGYGITSGDINGDGVDDIITVSANGDVRNGYDEGVIYALFGSSNAFADTVNISSLDGSNGFHIHRIEDSDYVSDGLTTGDVNGDGFDDIVYEDYKYYTYENSKIGHVIFGKSTAFADSLNLADLDGTNGFSMETTISGYGYANIETGDLNGDGFDELVVSEYDAFYYDHPVAHIIFGKSSGFSSVIDLANFDSANGLVVDDNDDSNTMRIHSVGDINGDGQLDMLFAEDRNASTISLVTNVNTNTITGDEGFRMLGAPASGVMFDDLLEPFFTQGFTGSDGPSGDTNVWTWDQVSQAWTALSNQQEDTLTAGNGFLLYTFGDDDADGSVEGFPKTISSPGAFITTRNDSVIHNNGTIIPVSDLDDGDFFFSANPFGSTIDWDDADITKTALSNTIYVWSDSANSGNGAWLTWNGSTGTLSDGEIAPFQAFFIEGFGGSGTLSIPEEALSGSTATLLKESPDLQPKVLKIHAEVDELSSEAILSFQEGGELGKDRFDGLALLPFSDSYLQLRLNSNSEEWLSINALPLDQSEYTLININPSGKNVSDIATLSFSGLEDFEGWGIEFVDTQTGDRFDVFALDEIQINVDHVKGKDISQSVFPSPTPVKAKAGVSRYQLHLIPNTIISNEQGSDIPTEMTLDQNYPNPFNPTTSINFTTMTNALVRLEVFDLVGRKVAELLNEPKIAGRYSINFDASQLASGLYLYRLQVGGDVLTRKMTLIK